MKESVMLICILLLIGSTGCIEDKDDSKGTRNKAGTPPDIAGDHNWFYGKLIESADMETLIYYEANDLEVTIKEGYDYSNLTELEYITWVIIDKTGTRSAFEDWVRCDDGINIRFPLTGTPPFSLSVRASLIIDIEFSEKVYWYYSQYEDRNVKIDLSPGILSTHDEAVFDLDHLLAESPNGIGLHIDGIDDEGNLTIYEPDGTIFYWHNREGGSTESNWANQSLDCQGWQIELDLHQESTGQTTWNVTIRYRIVDPDILESLGFDI